MIALGNSKVLLSRDKDGHVPSALTQVGKSTALWKLLADLESAASHEPASDRQPSFSQSSNTHLVTNTKRNSLSSTLFWASMITLMIVLLASQSISVRDATGGVLPAVICLVCGSIYLVNKLSGTSLPI